MKIIFDENVPWPLQRFFSGHIVSSVQMEGWSGKENGTIIELIDNRFDVFLPADKNLRYQQNLKTRKIAMVELPTNRWPIVQQMITRIVSAVENAHPGSYTILEV